MTGNLRQHSCTACVSHEPADYPDLVKHIVTSPLSTTLTVLGVEKGDLAEQQRSRACHDCTRHDQT